MSEVVSTDDADNTKLWPPPTMIPKNPPLWLLQKLLLLRHLHYFKGEEIKLQSLVWLVSQVSLSFFTLSSEYEYDRQVMIVEMDMNRKKCRRSGRRRLGEKRRYESGVLCVCYNKINMQAG